MSVESAMPEGYKHKKIVAAGYISDFKMFVSFVDTKQWRKKKSPAFSTHETLVVDMREFFKGFSESKTARRLSKNEKRVKDFILENGTIAWPGEGFWSTDFDGHRVWYNFDCDPALLYLSGKPVKLAGD